MRAQLLTFWVNFCKKKYQKLVFFQLCANPVSSKILFILWQYLVVWLTHMDNFSIIFSFLQNHIRRVLRALYVFTA